MDRRSGFSLLSTLLLVTIVLLVAATMAAVFTMNINITNRVSHGDVALSEAEAGLAEAFYHLTLEDNISETENSNNDPVILWGRSGETIRGTITPRMGPEEAYHVITFDPASPYPHSTNNTNLDQDSGSLARTVPDGKIHLVSTGYCKGQYRTIECVVEKPPFPFGLATSGPIISQDPIRVLGTSSVEALADGDEDRPGHLLCNSPEGVTIKAAPANSGLQTEISGFVKSSGPVDIEQPAVVRGGIRSNSDHSSLADIQVSNFRNQGEPGVITLMDSQYDEPQEMDVMYYHAGPTLRYTKRVELKQAMLYVEGDLVMDGPLSGEGLVVVDGNAHFKSGTALTGSNRMAILASGDITIEGNNNYFMGLVYCQGNLTASDITIVGNTIINSPSPDKGRAELSNVTVVSNEQTGDMTVTITSSSQATGGENSGENPPPVGYLEGMDVIGGTYGTNPYGYVDGDDGNQDNHKGAMKGLWDMAESGTGFPKWGGFPPGLTGERQALWEELKSIFDLADDVAFAVGQLNSQKDKIDKMDDDDPGKQAEEDKIPALEDNLEAALAKKADFDSSIDSYVDNVYNFVGSNTNSNSTFFDGIHDLDITEEVRFNLNEYLPESEKLKVSFWRVYPRRL